MKERSERRWRGGAVRAVKSQGGGVVARWRSVRVSGRRCWAGGLAWVQLTWLGCGLARRLASDEGLQNQPMAGLLQGLLQCCPGKLARGGNGGENGPTMARLTSQPYRWRGRHANSCGGEDNQGTWLRGHAHHS